MIVVTDKSRLVGRDSHAIIVVCRYAATNGNLGEPSGAGTGLSRPGVQGKTKLPKAKKGRKR